MRNFTVFLFLVLMLGACQAPSESTGTHESPADSSATGNVPEKDSAKPEADHSRVPDPMFPLQYASEGKTIQLHKIPTHEVDPGMYGKEDFVDEEDTFEPARENDCFTLPLIGGSSSQLCDIPEDSLNDEFREYDFWGSMIDLDFWMFHIYRYEGLETEFVSKKTGESSATLPGIAVSPDKKHLIAFQEMNGYGWASLEMYSIGEDDLELQWSIEMEDWGPEAIYWAPDGQVYMRGIFGDESYDHRPEHYLRLEVEDAP